MPSEIDIFREYVGTRADLGTVATEYEIDQFEARYNIKFPPDIREYFLKINGVYEFGGFITIRALCDWRLWSENEQGYDPPYISRILSELDQTGQYFCFGSYDFLVWDWLIRLDTDSTTSSPVFVTYEVVTKLADSFTEFLQKYRMNEPESLLGYG